MELDSVRSILKECALDTTIQGIPHIIKRPFYGLKAIWFICFCISLGFCIYGVYDSFTVYFQYKVVTETTIEIQNSIIFPTVTICNQNPFNTKSPNFKPYLESFKKEFYNEDFLNGLGGTVFEARVLVDRLLKSYIEELNISISEKIKLSYTLDDMLISCSYLNQPCDLKNFRIFRTNKYGNCYMFNSGKDDNDNNIDLLVTSTAGKSNSLRLELFTGVPSDDFDFMISNGFVVFVHNSTTLPFIDSENALLSPGYETNLILKQTDVIRLGTPFSSCIEDTYSLDSYNSDYYRKTIMINGKYNQKYCLLVCYQYYLLNKCGCYDPDSVGFDDYSSCNIYNMHCAIEAFIEFYNNQSNKCFDYCPQECDSIIFETLSSQASYPSPYYGNLLLRKESKNNSTRNLTSISGIRSYCLMVNLFYPDISYTKIEQTRAQTAEQLLSNIGGFLGLFVGASVLSIAEIIDILYLLINYWIFGPISNQFNEDGLKI